ncbi:hypothetical protein C8R45DRAFT_922907 [Mycena sanguinolenta]|nr:hypothetical protein C8R45DRAFT_922907 [Mycena sanguinolenta]
MAGTMPSISRAFLFVFAIFSIFDVNAWTCGNNGGTELGWGTPAAQNANDGHPPTVLGFSSTGPFDAAGNPILTVIATDAGFDSSFFEFNAQICGQDNSGSGQTNFGAILSTNNDLPSLCLTASGLEVSDITLSLLPCVNDIGVPPVATQSFEWKDGQIVEYELVFLGTTTGLPLKFDANTDYTPSLVPATNMAASYIRLDYTPGAFAPLYSRGQSKPAYRLNQIRLNERSPKTYLRSFSHEQLVLLNFSAKLNKIVCTPFGPPKVDYFQILPKSQINGFGTTN